MQTLDSSTSHSPNWLRRVLWVIIALLVTLIALAWFFLSQSILVDCGWGASAVAWVDENGNGRWDEGDAPLEGVEFYVNNMLDSRKIIASAISDWKGKAMIGDFLGPCEPFHFEVHAVPPSGYRFITNKVVNIAGNEENDPIMFGFAREEGTAPPMPYASQLTCKTYSWAARDIAVAADGAVWMVNRDGAISYDPPTDTWRSYPMNGGVPRTFHDIQLGSSGTVWVTGSNTVAGLQNSTWTYFTGTGDLIAASEASLGTTPDGVIWFKRHGLANNLLAFNPKMKTWKVYLTEGDTLSQYDRDVRIFTDGAVWRIVEGPRLTTALLKTTPTGWTFYDQHTFQSDEIEITPLDDWIYAAQITPDGKFWAIHTNGISRFDPASNTWSPLDLPFFRSKQGPQDIELAPDGSLWIAAAGYDHSVAVQFIPDFAGSLSGTWRRFDARDGIPDDRNIDRIEVDLEGGIWFGFAYQDVVVRCFLNSP